MWKFRVMLDANWFAKFYSARCAMDTLRRPSAPAFVGMTVIEFFANHSVWSIAFQLPLLKFASRFHWSINWRSNPTPPEPLYAFAYFFHIYDATSLTLR